MQCEIVFIDEVLGNIFHYYAGIFWAVNRGIHGEVTDVDAKEFSGGHEDHTASVHGEISSMVVTSPGYSTLSPMMMSLMHMGTAFCGHTSTTILMYATDLTLGILVGCSVCCHEQVCQVHHRFNCPKCGAFLVQQLDVDIFVSYLLWGK